MNSSKSLKPSEYNNFDQKFKIHSDFVFIRKKKLRRRLNVLIYLNENWKEEWKCGGYCKMAVQLLQAD